MHDIGLYRLALDLHDLSLGGTDFDLGDGGGETSQLQLSLGPPFGIDGFVSKRREGGPGLEHVTRLGLGEPEVVRRVRVGEQRLRAREVLDCRLEVLSLERGLTRLECERSLAHRRVDGRVLQLRPHVRRGDSRAGGGGGGERDREEEAESETPRGHGDSYGLGLSPSGSGRAGPFLAGRGVGLGGSISGSSTSTSIGSG